MVQVSMADDETTGAGGGGNARVCVGAIGREEKGEKIH
jgi:hypothetical protein